MQFLVTLVQLSFLLRVIWQNVEGLAKKPTSGTLDTIWEVTGTKLPVLPVPPGHPVSKQNADADHPVHNETLSNNYHNGQEPPKQPSTLLQPHTYLHPTPDLSAKAYHGLTEDHIPLSYEGCDLLRSCQDTYLMVMTTRVSGN